MSGAAIMTAACCCVGGGQIGTCPEWVNCRPQEIWISYSFSANYKQIVLPKFGATGIGGILREETESCSGTIRFIRGIGSVFGCGGLINNPMRDYRGNFSYSKIIVQNRFLDDADTYGPFCPDSCSQCLRIVQSSRVQTTASNTWDNTGIVSLYGTNGNIVCFRCIGQGGVSGGPRSNMRIFQRGNYSFSQTNYRCNGAIQSSGSGVLPNHYATFGALGRPQCLNASSFGDYFVSRDPTGCPIPNETPFPTITYPTCRVLPTDCDANGNPLYYEGDSINDCYGDYCVQRACYDPFPIISAGCGCANLLGSCDNPYPVGPPNNGCGEIHQEYTMFSSVTVTNVIP